MYFLYTLSVNRNGYPDPIYGIKANILEKFGIRKPEILMELTSSGVAGIDSAAALDNSGLLSEEDNLAVLPTEAQAESPEAPK